MGEAKVKAEQYKKNTEEIQKIMDFLEETKIDPVKAIVFIGRSLGWGKLVTTKPKKEGDPVEGIIFGTQQYCDGVQDEFYNGVMATANAVKDAVIDEATRKVPRLDNGGLGFDLNAQIRAMEIITNCDTIIKDANNQKKGAK